MENAKQKNDKNKILYGQFFTITNPFNVQAFFEWLNNIPDKKVTILEPFAGANNIVNLVNTVCKDFKKIEWKSYDIDTSFKNNAPEVPIEYRDTIADFPKGYDIVITNPPYLAKNSANRRGLDFPDTEYDDLYKLCLYRMLENVKYVAAIIPESFITSGEFTDRLYSVVSLTCKMFEDTECPVCLALFGPESSDDFTIYRMNRKVGTNKNIKKKIDKLFVEVEDISWKFNDPNGEIGIKCVDDTKKPSISFVEGSCIESSSIKVTSRAITRISCNQNIELNSFLKECNKVLEEYRKITGDVFLTSFKGLRDDGLYRRRLDFKTAKQIMNTALWRIKNVK